MERAHFSEFVNSFVQAWNQHDVRALLAAYAADADFVDVGGEVVHGRDAIAQRHRHWFATTLAGSRIAMAPIKIRPVSRRAALVQGIWIMRGHSNPSRDWLPVRMGILLFVFARKKRRWKVVLAQSTDTGSVQPASGATA